MGSGTPPGAAMSFSNYGLNAQDAAQNALATWDQRQQPTPPQTRAGDEVPNVAPDAGGQVVPDVSVMPDPPERTVRRRRDV